MSPTGASRPGAIGSGGRVPGRVDGRATGRVDGRVDSPIIGRIVCGGQTGVDRAAMTAAVTGGLPYGGWVPRGGWAEDLPDPPGLLALHPAFTPTPSADPAQRTVWNVRDSDVTVLIVPAHVDSPGSTTTARACSRLGRPLVCTPLGAEADAVLRRLSGYGTDLAVNVAGPRESEAPGIQREATRLLGRVFDLDR